VIILIESDNHNTGPATFPRPPDPRGVAVPFDNGVYIHVRE